MADAIEMIATERQRQVDVEGWTPDHDDEHDCGDLALAAATYAMPPDYREREPGDPLNVPREWPWREADWKPTPDDRIRELVKAGALIVAEIERLQREVSG